MSVVCPSLEGVGDGEDVFGAWVRGHEALDEPVGDEDRGIPEVWLFKKWDTDRAPLKGI